VGLVGEPLSPVAGTLSEVDGDGKGGGTGGDVNGSPTSKVETTLDERPSVGVPRHTRKWVVDNGRPDEGEQKGRAEATAFGDSANGDHRGDCGEHALVNTKYQCGNTGGTNGWLALDIPEGKVLEVTDEWVGTVAEGERVAPEPPLKRHDAEDRDRKVDERKSVLPP